MYSRYDFIKDLNSSKKEWRIKVRVVRTWNVPNFQRKDFDDNLDMVLLDEKGARIHATVKGSLNVRKKICEGDVYFIKIFGVGLNIDHFRPTRHDYRLSFNLRTNVKSIVDATIPAYGFSFVDFDVIERESTEFPYLVVSLINVQPLFFVDVIGLLSGIGDVCEHVVSGRKTKMVVLELDDLRLSSDPIESGMRLTQLSSQSLYSFENDFMKDTERKSISDIKNCSEITTCIMYGIIKSIESKYNWWYKSYKKCPYSVCEDFEKWFCKYCQEHWDDYCPKFSVQVRVVDNTDSASFILFDRVCVALLGIGAAEIREQHFKRGADLELYLEEINIINDKTMLFKVNVKKKHLDSLNEPKYQVSRVCSNESIIQSFLKSVMESNDDTIFDNTEDNDVDVESQTCESTGDADVSLSLLSPSLNLNNVVDDKCNSFIVRPLKKIKLEKELSACRFDGEAGDTKSEEGYP
ncbi:uncharacterized protein LOC133306467 [Gastrolobium bilobum]|uniref:uncharacterized protein LOC133306467 n=1 Tax=Gastrolobium bilobum TaxID=150636 RepID=UPI002AB2E9CD|nr:uncharacterized protein LOC133306467 [Gastrolobium bilobum]